MISKASCAEPVIEYVELRDELNQRARKCHEMGRGLWSKIAAIVESENYGSCTDMRDDTK